MKNLTRKIATIGVIGAISIGAMTACAPVSDEYQDRKAAQSTSQITNSLEKKNLEKKRDKEEDSNAIRYVYLMNYGNITGYYVIQGKVSSSGSQIGPEQEIIKRWSDGYVLDSAQDDGTYGEGDPGVFFFTTDGTMVETSLDYVISDRPITLDVPRLGGSAPAAKK
jgi:hypothetical protein